MNSTQAASHSKISPAFQKVTAIAALVAGTLLAPAEGKAQTSVGLKWDRNDPLPGQGPGAGKGVRVYSWEYDPVSSARSPASPIVTSVPDSLSAQATETRIILGDGRTYEIAVVAYNDAGESGFSNSVFPVTQAPDGGQLRGAGNSENTFFINKSGAAFLYGGMMKDVVLVRGSASHIEGYLYNGDDFLEGGAAGTANIFNMGPGNDTALLNGGSYSLTGESGADRYIYSKAQFLSSAAAPVITDFDPAADVFEIPRDALENVLYFPQSDATLYLGFTADPSAPDNVVLWLNPWGTGFGTDVPPQHYKQAAVFLNAAEAFRQVDENLDTVNLVVDLMATRNLELKRDFAEIVSGRHQYERYILQNIPNFSPTNGSTLVLPWVPGFPALTDQMDDIDRFVIVTSDNTDPNTAIIFFNPYGRGNRPGEIQEIVRLPGTMPSLMQITQPGDTSVAAAMMRNGNLFPLKLMKEYVINAAAFNAGIVQILGLGRDYDPFEGDRIVITHAPGYTPGVSGVNDFFNFVLNGPTDRSYGALRPYIGSTPKYVVRIDNSALILPLLPDAGETIEQALERMGALHIVPAPGAPPRAPIEQSVMIADYGPQPYTKIISYGTQFEPDYGDSIVVRYAPGYSPGDDIDNFVTFVPGSNGSSLFVRLKPSVAESFDYVMRLDGALGPLTAQTPQGMTIAEYLEARGALAIQHEAPHVPVVHNITQQIYETGPYPTIKFGDQFKPDLGDRIVLRHAPGFIAGTDIDNFAQFVVGSDNSSVFLKTRPNYTSPMRYVLKITFAATALSNMPNEPGETIAEALNEIGAFTIEPGP